MMETKHIDVNAALAAGLDRAQNAHLESCAACRAQWDSARAEIATLRSIDASLDKVPEMYWEAQRRNIRVRAAEAQPQKAVAGRLAWVTVAAAAVVVSVSLMLPQPKTSQGQVDQIAPQSAVAEISDAALIRGVQDDLESYPEALHPAQVMYVEMSSAQAPAVKRK